MIFNREPALWLGLLYAVVTFVSAFVIQLTADQQGAINAVGAALVGLITAWSLAEGGLQAAILGLFKAALALALAFGLQMSAENQAVAMGLVTAVVAMFIRTQAIASVDARGVRRGVGARTVFGISL